MTATLPAIRAGAEGLSEGHPFTSTEERILVSALALIGRRGVRRLAMSEISEAAGVSRATLYRYFPSKEHVLAAAADYDGQRFRAGLDHALAAAVGPEERIAAFMSYSFAFIRTHSARSLFESEPEFVMSYLLAHLPSLREEMLVRVGSDLDAVPAVRRGELNREQLADLVVRLFASSWIIPEPDDDSLVESLTQILHIPTTAPAAMEANR